MANVSVAGNTVNIAAAGATPVPLRLTLSGVGSALGSAVALKVMSAVPLTGPAMVGVKIRVIVQLVLAAKVAVGTPTVQVPPAAPIGRTTAKVVGSTKVSRVIATALLLVTVNDCGPLAALSATLPNANAAGNTDAVTAEGTTPVPLARSAYAMPPGIALLVTLLVTLLFCAPAVVGLKLSVTTHVALGAKGLAAAQVSVTTYPAGATKAENDNRVAVLFCKVRLCGGLVAPVLMLPNAKGKLGVTAMGAGALVVMVAVLGLMVLVGELMASLVMVSKPETLDPVVGL